MRRLVLAFALSQAACAATPAPPAGLTVLTRDGCVLTDAMRKNLDAALTSMHRPLNYQVVDLDASSPADPRRGYPTPTLLIGDVDLFDMPAPTPPFPEPT